MGAAVTRAILVSRLTQRDIFEALSRIAAPLGALRTLVGKGLLPVGGIDELPNHLHIDFFRQPHH